MTGLIRSYTIINHFLHYLTKTGKEGIQDVPVCTHCIVHLPGISDILLHDLSLERCHRISSID